MNRVAAIGLMLLLTTSAQADWKGLKNGMDPHAAWECTGMPLMQYGARGAEMWTYDFGGYILFENGRITCWGEPKPVAPRPGKSALASQPKQPVENRREVATVPAARIERRSRVLTVATADPRW